MEKIMHFVLISVKLLVLQQKTFNITIIIYYQVLKAQWHLKAIASRKESKSVIAVAVAFFGLPLANKIKTLVFFSFLPKGLIKLENSFRMENFT